MTARFDAIVIGGSLGGLVASTYLRRAGKSVLLLEAEERLGGELRRAPYLSALDPRTVKELGLAARGLKFALRDMPTTGLREDGRHLTLARDAHDAARAIAAFSPADAQAYRRYHAELTALARGLRPFWWEDAPAPRWSPLLARLGATSAQAYLSGWFETEALKAMLAFDVPHAQEPGSALALAWRAAQEMGGLQGALAVPQGGCAALADQLIATAEEAGVELRAQARVAKLILDGQAVAGMELDSGEQVFTRVALSSLSRRETLLELAPTASAGFAETQRLMRARPSERETEFVFALNAAAEFGKAGMRFVAGELEAVVAASPQAGQHLLFVRAKGAPEPDSVLAQLERAAPLLRSRVVAQERRMRDVSALRLTEPAWSRLTTPVEGLLLCGRDAEPLDAVSGRAGRLAAQLAVRENVA